MQTWVIGNWKQNPATSHEVDVLLNDLINTMPTETGKDMTSNQSCQLMVAPGCVHLAAVSMRLKDTGVLCAAQDIGTHSDTIGAFTGDCSAKQIADAGATWTILGHSERRQYHHECHDSLVQKLTHAFAQKLGVILCIGETQAQYDAQQTLTVLDEQLAVLKEWFTQQPDVVTNVSDRLVIAYEPVWAIGTGKVPTVSEVSMTHRHIKQTVTGFASALSDISVLYGGSVNMENAEKFAADSMINGALVGGASLKANSFLAIAAAFSKTPQ